MMFRDDTQLDHCRLVPINFRRDFAAGPTGLARQNSDIDYSSNFGGIEAENSIASVTETMGCICIPCAPSAGSSYHPGILSKAPKFKLLKDNFRNGSIASGVSATSETTIAPFLLELQERDFMVQRDFQFSGAKKSSSKFLPSSKSMPSVKVPLDFGHKSGPRIVTKPSEIEAVVQEDHQKSAASRLRSALSPRGPPLPLQFFVSTEPWFHAGLSRSDAERRLITTNHVDEGNYLVRTSESLNGAFVLSVVHTGEVYHFPITSGKDTSPEALPHLSLDGGSTVFKDLEQLVDFYSLNAGYLPTKLKKPIARVDVHSGAQNRTFDDIDSPVSL